MFSRGVDDRTLDQAKVQRAGGKGGEAKDHESRPGVEGHGRDPFFGAEKTKEGSLNCEKLLFRWSLKYLHVMEKTSKYQWSLDLMQNDGK